MQVQNCTFASIHALSVADICTLARAGPAGVMARDSSSPEVGPSPEPRASAREPEGCVNGQAAPSSRQQPLKQQQPRAPVAAPLPAAPSQKGWERASKVGASNFLALAGRSCYLTLHLNVARVDA